MERPFVEVQIAGNLAATAGLRRDDGSGAPPIIVEDRVAAQSVACDFLDPLRDPGAGVALAGRKNDACEIVESHCDGLGGQAARSSDRTFFTE